MYSVIHVVQYKCMLWPWAVFVRVRFGTSVNVSNTLYSHCFDSVEVTTSPESVNASVGDVVVLSCVGSGDYITWKVNGKPVDSKEGFWINDTVLDDDTMLRTGRLIVNTSFVTNGTNITCIAIYLSPVLSKGTSDPAVILLQGTIPSIVINMQLYN